MSRESRRLVYGNILYRLIRDQVGLDHQLGNEGSILRERPSVSGRVLLETIDDDDLDGCLARL